MPLAASPLISDLLKFLNANKDAFESLKAVATTGGIVIAGWWTWKMFISKREKFPRATVTHEVSTWKLSNSHRLVRVHLLIKNESDILLCMSKGHTWIQQMRPWPPELLHAANEGSEIVPPNQTEFSWPIIAERDFEFHGQKEVEPKESDEIILDFVINIECEQILVYSFVENYAKVGRNLGWNASTIVDISAPTHQATGEQIMSERKDHSGGSGDKGMRQAQSKPRPDTHSPNVAARGSRNLDKDQRNHQRNKMSKHPERVTNQGLPKQRPETAQTGVKIQGQPKERPTPKEMPKKSG